MSVVGKIFVDLTFGREECYIRKTYSFEGFKITGEGEMPFVLPAGKAVTVTLQLFDRFDNPTRFDGAPSWETSDPAVLTVTATGDGYTAELRSVGPETPVGGGVQWLARGDADLGQGTREMIVQDTITIPAGDAFRGSGSYGPIID